VISVIPTPARWPSDNGKLQAGLYDTTLLQACTLVRRADSTGRTAFDSREPRFRTKSDIRNFGHPTEACVIQVSVAEKERAVYVYNAPRTVKKYPAPTIVIWSVGNTGVTAQHIANLIASRSDFTWLRRELQDPRAATIYGRYLNKNQIEAALSLEAA
jgi:hypothetical protein